MLFSCAIVVAKNLLIKVTEQMKRFDRNIRAMQAALHQRPKVFDAVRVYLSLYVRLRKVNDLVNASLVQSQFSGKSSVERLVPGSTCSLTRDWRVGLLRCGMASHLTHSAKDRKAKKPK